MRILGKVSLSFSVRIFCDMLLVLNVLTLIVLPFFLPSLYEAYKGTYLIQEKYDFLLVFLYVTGTIMLAVLCIGHMILRSLEKNQPFDPRNPRYFVLLGVAFFLLSLTLFTKLFIVPTVLTLFCAGLFLVLTLLSLILAEVFRQACKVWEEHQLTI